MVVEINHGTISFYSVLLNGIYRQRAHFVLNESSGAGFVEFFHTFSVVLTP